ncbi:efflux RND transporter periplasmic adaptor subunit [Shewanella insulae]|uniref:Efflux RND transporter periplasmic adaptor subunit n=1 Tax=Shewanella insulae TaxID=2681496 RepID=A0A6L7HSJ5_9GAMM|nr:efflux RND transporter periplasmic adaptor subunit [Shewanella insulae]MCG9714663.1 efflux RND transporter periplasmic adaptor subunit [Shewanella insulae]MCG9738938.1 efflux RND transporter periplasmic adaptor subunit [Shewanella insulae]MCG9756680.1 efflux RND transporter periplasmic adaptor subunit [Shewanella insulae]MXR67236.1 efflux RND transporter periplasmic adaptor subunit [Shewanella insulae]
MKKTIIISMLLAAGAATYYFTQQTDSPKGPRTRPTPNVVIAKAEMQPIRDEVEALGTGKANESITVTPKVTDMVTEINFDDGQMVDKGRLLVRLQDREQSARVTVARVKMKDHQRELARISSLVTSQTVAALERDRLQTLIDTAKAELEQAESALKDRRILAPFSGRLGLRQVSKGSLVTPGTVITTLDDISTIKLDFSVPERFLQSLAIGKSVEASAVAFEGELFTGKVVSVDSRVNPTTRAVTVRAEIPNKDLRLLPGMLMKVKLIKQSRNALIIPEAAIIPIQRDHFVYLVNDENVVERRQVQLGLRKRGWVEIVDGVEVGEQVMVRGILKVRPGDTVKVQYSEHFSFNQQAKVEPLA